MDFFHFIGCWGRILFHSRAILIISNSINPRALYFFHFFECMQDAGPPISLTYLISFDYFNVYRDSSIYFVSFNVCSVQCHYFFHFFHFFKCVQGAMPTISFISFISLTISCRLHGKQFLLFLLIFSGCRSLYFFSL